jgi:hypothetical protein
LQLEALGTLARIHLARSGPAARRSHARGSWRRDPSALAAVTALVAVTRGTAPQPRAALAEATAGLQRCLPGTEIAQLTAQARAAVAALDR